ncbi:MAG: hypothetical protein GXP37_07455 [Chloroflexi bacterium]|nr:hypothetical protein [Chloroflexota bacterium]
MAVQLSFTRRWKKPKTSVITARVEPELKEEAEKVISQVGLTMSQAMN